MTVSTIESSIMASFEMFWKIYRFYAVMLGVLMQNGIMLGVVLLNVTAPIFYY